MTAPPGVREADFSAALEAFRKAVGADWVFVEPEDLALYRDAYSIIRDEPDERVASAAVAPASVEEVQQVVRIANRFRLPLYPISTGRNLAYGGAAPAFSGSVVIDLKRMNRILEVDDKRHFALVEPGVSYFDLYRHIKERGLKVWLDVPDPGWGSPVGNSLDHGVGYTYAPYRDHFSAHCGMEVVTAEGEVVRTGMGALPNSDSWQDNRYAVGPYVDGLFAQSNFGIVTKMGFWLMPQPESFLRCEVYAPRYADLERLIEEISYLEDMGMIGLPLYSSPYDTGFGPKPPELAALVADGWPDTDRIERFVRERGKPAWSVGLIFYTPPDVAQATWAYVKTRLSAAIPGVTFEDGKPIPVPLTPEEEGKLNEKIYVGIPSLYAFRGLAREPPEPDQSIRGHADLLPIVPRNAQAVQELPRVVDQCFREMGLETRLTPFATPVAWFQRSFLMSVFFYVYNSSERNRRTREIASVVMRRMAEHGWAVYRSAPVFQDELASLFSYNDHALLRFQERLKDAVDPNGILAPGRYGLWPKHMRGAKQ